MVQPEIIARRLIISGRVQGVGYRAWAQRQGNSLKLRGWVRNRDDGTVEMLAIGPPAAVEHLTTACRQGPTHAHVTLVQSKPAEDDGSIGFRWTR